jgi:hypothetical protein
MTVGRSWRNRWLSPMTTGLIPERRYPVAGLRPQASAARNASSKRQRQRRLEAREGESTRRSWHPLPRTHNKRDPKRSLPLTLLTPHTSMNWQHVATDRKLSSGRAIGGRRVCKKTPTCTEDTLEDILSLFSASAVLSHAARKNYC